MKFNLSIGTTFTLVVLFVACYVAIPVVYKGGASNIFVAHNDVLTFSNILNKKENETTKALEYAKPVPSDQVQTVVKNTPANGDTEENTVATAENAPQQRADTVKQEIFPTVLFGPDKDRNNENISVEGLVGQSTNPREISLAGPTLPDSYTVDGLNGICAYDCAD